MGRPQFSRRTSGSDGALAVGLRGQNSGSAPRFKFTGAMADCFCWGWLFFCPRQEKITAFPGGSHTGGVHLQPR